MNNIGRLGTQAARAAQSAIRNQSMDSVQQGMARGLFTGRKIEQKTSQTVKDRVLEGTRNTSSSMTTHTHDGKNISSRQASEGRKTNLSRSTMTSGNSSGFSDEQLSATAQSAKEAYTTSQSAPSSSLTLSQAVILTATKTSLPLKTQAALGNAMRAYNASAAAIKPLQERTGSVG